MEIGSGGDAPGSFRKKGDVPDHIPFESSPASTAWLIWTNVVQKIAS